MNELSKKKDISRQVQFINSSALDCCTKDNVHLLPFDCSFFRLGVLQLAHIMYGVPRFNTAYSWFCLPKLLGLSNIIIKTNHTWSISIPYISMTNTERSADCCLRLLLSNSMCFFDNNNVVQCGWGQIHKNSTGWDGRRCLSTAYWAYTLTTMWCLDVHSSKMWRLWLFQANQHHIKSAGDGYYWGKILAMTRIYEQ